MGELQTEVVAILNERAADAAANRLVSKFTAAGKTSGDAFARAMEAEAQRTNIAMDSIRTSLEQKLTDSGGRAGRGFGRSFGSELASSIPGVSGFASTMAGYETAAGKVGALAGRALGLAFTTAAAGLIGAAGYTLFKGFERYEAIDAARNRLEVLNRTLEKTGRQTYDIQAVMGTVNSVVENTKFSLDQAFSLSTVALSSPTGDLKRFMTAVADTAQFTGENMDSIGQAFINIANKGKVSMEELTNQLRKIPQSWLADHFKVGGAELAKMIHDNKVGLEDLLQTIEANIGGLAKDSVDTVEGQLEQVGTAVSRLGANALSALFGKPTESGNNLVEVLKVLRERIDDVNTWVTAHQDDIRKFFEGGIAAGRDIASLIGDLTKFLGGTENAIKLAGAAFLAWKTQGVFSTVMDLTSNLRKTGDAVDVLPDKATTAARGISAAFATIIVPAIAQQLNDELNKFLKENAPDLYRANHAGEDSFGGPVDWGAQLNPWSVENRRRRAAETGGSGWNIFASPPPPPPSGPVAAGDIFAGPYSRTGGGNGPHGGAGDRKRQEQLDRQPPGGAPAGAAILPAPGMADGGKSGGGPKLPAAPVLPYDSTLPPSIPGMPQDASVFGAESSFLDARHKLAEKRARVAQLETDSNATEQDRLKARNDVIEAERDLQAAEMRMGEARASQYEKLTKQTRQHLKDLGDIGASIDRDLGISKGLAGIAENITKFMANLAAAPVLGRLQAISQANPSQGGYGAMGVLAAQGAFGPNYTGIDYSKYGYGAASVMGPAALQPASFGGGNLGAMMALAQAVSGNVKYGPASDMINGLADCSGSISDLVEVLQTGRSTPGRLFDTTAFASDESAAKLGFRPGYQPGALNVGVTPLPGSSGHMAATLPNGVNFEGGGRTGGGAQYGGSATGALDPQFSKHYYMPVGPSVPYVSTPSAADIYSAANQDPTLSPAVPALAGVPSMPGGMLPGMGAPSAAPFATKQYGGVEPPQGIGKGGIGMDGGGALGMAVQAGGMALDAMAPGAGQGAQTGVKLINRGIEFGSQVVGIGVQGLLDTALPFGGSELAANNWATRVFGALAGAVPAIPNVAGKSANAKDVANIDPAAAARGEVQPITNNTTNIQVDASNREARGIANEIDWHDGNRNTGPGM